MTSAVHAVRSVLSRTAAGNPPEDRKGGSEQPVHERRFLEPWRAVDGRDREVAGLEHFPRHLRVRGLVGGEVRARVQGGQRREQGQGEDEQGLDAAPLHRGSLEGLRMQ